jgi:hypothetical protein
MPQAGAFQAGVSQAQPGSVHPAVHSPASNYDQLSAILWSDTGQYKVPNRARILPQEVLTWSHTVKMRLAAHGR